jgi:phage terminase large subunit-like protein
LTIDRSRLSKGLDARKALIRKAAKYPLSVARLWEPHCCRWDGLGNESPRARGCGQAMSHISGGVFRCDRCGIVEPRTSQREVIRSILLGSDACLIAGGNRAGKTELACMLAIAVAAGSGEHWIRDWMALNAIPKALIPEKPGTVWIANISYGDSLEYMRPKLDLLLPKGTKRRQWGANNRGLAVLPNNGRIVSMSMDSGRSKFQGGSPSLVILDEEPPEDIFDESMLRVVDAKGRVVVSATPLKGLTWMHHRFIEKPYPGFSTDRISGLDNPYVSSVKMKSAVAHLTEASQRSRLFGEFTSQAGLVYSEFSPSLHIQSVEIGEGWERHRSIDFGSTHPFCCLWVAVIPSGAIRPDPVLYVYQELYQTGLTTIEAGRQINEMSGDDSFFWTVADPESKDGRLTLKRECMIPTLKAPKFMGVLEGIGMVRELLAVDGEGKPGILIHPDCKNLIREFKLYRWDSRSKRDRPQKLNDHALDALRYEIMQWVRYNRHR